MAKIKKALSTVKAVFNNLKSGTRKINEILQSIRGRKVDLVESPLLEITPIKPLNISPP